MAKPNGWSRDVRSITRQATQVAATDRQKLLLAYWAAFADFLRTATPHFKPPKPGRDHWKTFGIGKSGFNLNFTALAQAKRIGVELYISRASAKEDFQFLEAQREKLEAAFGEVLIWENLPGKKGARISVQALASDPADELDWSNQFFWAHSKLSKFREVFAKPIRGIPESSSVSDNLEA